MLGRASVALVAPALPGSALAGDWTDPQGTELLIETLFGWAGVGAP